jgi:farnesyl-diphosphate farnesyltransferase
MAALAASAQPRDLDADIAFQARILEGVSRTFALTIPQLPEPLYVAVANAYLLCRIADTIEDDPDLSSADKRTFAERFVAVLDGDEAAMRFSDDLYPRLGAGIPEAERELVLNTPRVVRVTHSLDGRQQGAMRRCVRIMSRGMASFQDDASVHGLADLASLDRYCYHVAGVVGEMLTELFCVHNAALARRRDELLRLSVSFGQGLQMTNILKDVWDDHRRGVCWLPRDVFARHGYDLSRLAPGARDPAFLAGYDELVAVARGHLEHALTFTLRMPPAEVGIRRFCLWALGMAVLTLRRIHRRRGFSDGSQVKISRRQVKLVVAVTNLAVRQDWLLKALFYVSTRALPGPPNHAHPVST